MPAPQGPQVVVNLVLQNSAGDVLLFERTGTDTAVGTVVLPGGRVEDNESLHQAALRELAEEVGVTATAADLVFAGVYDRPSSSRPTERGLHVFFHVTAWQGTPHSAEPHKHGPATWYSPTTLPPRTHPLDRMVIQNGFSSVCVIL